MVRHILKKKNWIYRFLIKSYIISYVYIWFWLDRWRNFFCFVVPCFILNCLLHVHGPNEFWLVKKVLKYFHFCTQSLRFFILSAFERIAPVFTFQFHEFSRFSSIFYTIVCSFRMSINCHQKIKKHQNWICRFLNRRSSNMSSINRKFRYIRLSVRWKYLWRKNLTIQIQLGGSNRSNERIKQKKLILTV